MTLKTISRLYTVLAMYYVIIVPRHRAVTEIPSYCKLDYLSYMSSYSVGLNKSILQCCLLHWRPKLKYEVEIEA